VPLALLSLNEAKFIEINESLQKQWHYVREDVIGKTTHELGIWEDLATREYFIQLLQNQGFIDQLEVRLCDKNGIAATCLLSARLFQSDGHDMVIFSPIDISRLREIEDEIRNLNIQLEERVMQRTLSLKHANQELEAALSAMRNMQAEMFRSEKMAALGYLVAGIAHELNTPIGNSLMVASTLKEHADQITMELSAQQPRRSVLGELNSETKKGVNILMRSLERAAQLIISFKQVAVDQSSNHRRSFDLSKTLEEVLTTLEMMYRPASHRLELDLEPGVQMDSYPGALAQILTNVISNAVTHGFENRQHGTMRLTTRRLHDLHVTLSFNDNGMGISSPDQARVFDPFFTTKLGQGGSGLGMHIVYNLVTEVLGGKIELSSALGVGTTFIIVLPLIAPNTPHKKEG
jgi:PAS domain S-box-containing protein